MIYYNFNLWFYPGVCLDGTAEMGKYSGTASIGEEPDVIPWGT